MPSSTSAVIFAALYVTYAVCYMCRRLNYSVLVENGVVDASDVGSFGSAFEMAGGAIKGVAGVLVDMYSPVAVLITAAGTAAVSNLMFFKAPSTSEKVALWGLNGAAQGLAWPAIARIFMSWFPDPAGRGTWYSALSTSQNLGAALAPHIIAPAVAAFGWTANLYAPGVLALICVLAVAAVVKDAPPSGKDSVTGKPTSASSPRPPLWAILRTVCRSPTLWLLGASCFFTSLARNAVADWGGVFLTSAGVPPATVRACASAFEVGGAAGGLAAGWASDHLSGGRRGPVMALAGWLLVPLPILVAALATGGEAVPAMRALPQPLGPLTTLAQAAGEALDGGARLALLPWLFASLGVLIYTPHVLNGLASGEAVHPAMSASAGALSKTLGQLGGAAAGLPLGRLAARRGWPAVMVGLSWCALAAAITVTPLWHAKPWKPAPERSTASAGSSGVVASATASGPAGATDDGKRATTSTARKRR